MSYRPTSSRPVPPAIRHVAVRYSQNFLRSRRLAEQLLDQSSVTADDLVLDIGAGRGRITEPLAQRCRTVLAIEKDARLASLLRERLQDVRNVRIVAADFLETGLPRQPYKVFATFRSAFHRDRGEAHVSAPAAR